ncbi:MAG: hypothetical protein Q7T03_05195 [Deltaproteobacteria bacterium]|nr:hypothetical protein [Deltaproteobacteria bacterium]
MSDPIKNLHGFRRVLVELDQSAVVVGVVPVSRGDADILEVQDVSVLAEGTKSLLAEIAGNGGYHRPMDWYVVDRDGDEKSDFYFYREYAPQKLGIEFFLSRSLSPLESLEIEKFANLLEGASMEQPVSIVLVGGIGIRVAHVETDNPLLRLFLDVSEKLIQKKLRFWNRAHGPDGVLVLDSQIAEDRLHSDLVPGSEEYIEALTFIRSSIMVVPSLPASPPAEWKPEQLPL